MPIQYENFLTAIKEKQFPTAYAELNKGNAAEIVIALKDLIADASVEPKIIVDFLLIKLGHPILVQALDGPTPYPRAETILLAILKVKIEMSLAEALRFFVKFSPTRAKNCFILLRASEQEKMLFLGANASAETLKTFFANIDPASQRELVFKTPRKATCTILSETMDGKDILMTNGVEWLQNENDRSKLADPALTEPLTEFINTLTLSEKASYISRAFEGMDDWEEELEVREQQEQEENQAEQKDEKQQTEIKTTESASALTHILPTVTAVSEVKIEVKENVKDQKSTMEISPHYLWWQEEKAKRLADVQHRRQAQQSCIIELRNKIKNHITFVARYIFDNLELNQQLDLLLHKKLSRTARGKILLLQPHKYLDELAHWSNYGFRYEPPPPITHMINVSRRKIFNSLKADDLALLFLFVSSQTNKSEAENFTYLMKLWTDIGPFIPQLPLKTKIIEKFVENGKSVLAATIFRQFDFVDQKELLARMKADAAAALFVHLEVNEFYVRNRNKKILAFLIICVLGGIFLKDNSPSMIDRNLNMGLFFLIMLFLTTSFVIGSRTTDKNLSILTSEDINYLVRSAIFSSFSFTTQVKYLANFILPDDLVSCFFRDVVTKDSNKGIPLLSAVLKAEFNFKVHHCWYNKEKMVECRLINMFLKAYGESAVSKAKAFNALLAANEHKIIKIIWSSLGIPKQAEILQATAVLLTEDTPEAKTVTSIQKNLFSDSSLNETDHVALLNAIGSESVANINLQHQLILLLAESYPINGKQQVAALFKQKYSTPHLNIEVILISRLIARRPDLAAFIIAETKRFFDKIPENSPVIDILRVEYPITYSALPLALKSTAIIRSEVQDLMGESSSDLSTVVVPYRL